MNELTWAWVKIAGGLAVLVEGRVTGARSVVVGSNIFSMLCLLG